MTEITKYQNSNQVDVKRSEIHFASYNPREISDFAATQIRKNIRKIGLLGGIVVNKLTMNIVSGHQRVSALDAIEKYNPETHENDYVIRVEMIDVDFKTEKEQNIFMNSASVQGEFDWTKLKPLALEIDTSAAGLTDSDLNFIGIELFKDNELGLNSIEDDLKDLIQPTIEEREARKAEIKAVKQQIKEKAEEKAQSFDSYIVLNFRSLKAKQAFCKRFDLSNEERFVDGETFSDQIERVM